MINKNKKPLTICVTGSNGKSTTTSLINHILNSISNNSELGGNIGRPVLELNNNKSIKFNVLELSSYQIEIANFLSPDIAIFLNLSSDHLERHGGIGGYFNAKARLFYYGLPKFSIINIDQPEGRYLANILEKNSNMNTQVICLSSNKTNTNSKWSISLEDDFIVERKDGLETFRYNIHQYVNLPGEHNLINSCIAFITCKLLQIDSSQILKYIKNFKGLPHRAELVKKINEITFINDSKATNMDSALKSIMTYNKIRWIAGGQKKDGDKVNIVSQKKKIKKIYLIGSSAFELSKLFDGMNCSIFSDLDVALKRAFKDAEPGDTILFAPGCASFDQFENFEKRGEKFCELVHLL
jgi:UDP-N-acetylmuramoylalanine--D-glutamate ligase